MSKAIGKTFGVVEEIPPKPGLKRSSVNSTTSPKKRSRTSRKELIWLCFDLNGCLCSLTKHRKKGLLQLRPGCCELQKLKDKGFALGVFSSATKKTVASILEMLRTKCSIEFDKVFCRDDCRLVGSGHATVKPLLKNGLFNLERVILIDDVKEKAAPGESKNMLLVPPWKGNKNDRFIFALVNALLAPSSSDHLGVVETKSHRKKNTQTEENQPPFLLSTNDVRNHVSDIARKAWIDISWKAKVSRTNGKIYYFNHLLNTSSWDIPPYYEG